MNSPLLESKAAPGRKLISDWFFRESSWPALKWPLKENVLVQRLVITIKKHIPEGKAAS